jgi:hypothetical protein
MTTLHNGQAPGEVAPAEQGQVLSRSVNTATRRGKSASTQRLESAILEIVNERAPITVRGVAYALFTRGLIDSMATNNTAKVSRVMTAMREEDELDWTQIVDGSRAIERVSTWSNPSAIINAAVRGYRRNYWQDQDSLVEVWSEKSTVAGVLAPVLNEFGVTFRVMKGFGSFTSVRQAAEDSLDVPDHKNAVALYIGDYDPSGVYMSEIDLPGRLERYGSEWEFERIAVLETDTYDLPAFDAATKSGDMRYRWFVENYGQHCWELDAINPTDLRNRVREQIETRLNLPAWAHAKRIEAVEIASMKQFHKAWAERLGVPK